MDYHFHCFPVMKNLILICDLKSFLLIIFWCLSVLLTFHFSIYDTVADDIPLLSFNPNKAKSKICRYINTSKWPNTTSIRKLKTEKV